MTETIWHTNLVSGVLGALVLITALLHLCTKSRRLPVPPPPRSTTVGDVKSKSLSPPRNSEAPHSHQKSRKSRSRESNPRSRDRVPKSSERPRTSSVADPSTKGGKSSVVEASENPAPPPTSVPPPETPAADPAAPPPEAAPEAVPEANRVPEPVEPPAATPEAAPEPAPELEQKIPDESASAKSKRHRRRKHKKSSKKHRKRHGDDSSKRRSKKSGRRHRRRALPPEAAPEANKTPELPRDPGTMTRLNAALLPESEGPESRTPALFKATAAAGKPLDPSKTAPKLEGPKQEAVEPVAKEAPAVKNTPKQIPRDPKADQIARLGLKRGRDAYPTMNDVLSDWESKEDTFGPTRSNEPPTRQSRGDEAEAARQAEQEEQKLRRQEEEASRRNRDRPVPPPKVPLVRPPPPQTPPVDPKEIERVQRLRAQHQATPKKFVRNSWEEKIARGDLVRRANEYPTFNDICSDWESVDKPSKEPAAPAAAPVPSKKT